MKFAARAVVALSLLAGVYLLAGAIVLGLGFAVYEALTRGIGGYLLGKASGLLLVLALGLVSAFWSAFRHRAQDPMGLALSPDAQPALWQELHDLAGSIGTRPPDEVLLVPEINASVMERSRLLGLVPGRRVLTLGAPLVQGLDRQQLRSVLAHELGHYSHRHTALAPTVYRGHVTLARLALRFQGTLTGRVFEGYGRLYHRVTGAVTRQQELEADGWSHRLAGREAAASALRELPALEALWCHFLEEYAFRVPGARPEDFFAGFQSLLASPVRREEMDRIRAELPVEEASPYDTHPSLRSRVEHFEGLPDDGIPADGGPAVAVLADAEEVLRELEAVMFGSTELEPTSWASLGELAGLRRARGKAAMLVRAAGQDGAGAATLGEALRRLARRDTRVLVRPFVTHEVTAEDVDAIARDLVTAAVAVALVEHCGATFRMDWSAGDTVVDPEGRTIDVAGLVDELVEQRSADWLARALTGEGVPMSFAVDPAEIDAENERDRPPVVHAIAVCLTRFRTRVLVVADTGLVVKRIGWRESLTAMFKHGGSDWYATALRYVASLPPSAFSEDPRATTYAWDQVTRVRLRRRRVVLAVDGRKQRLKVKRRAVAGDLLESMRQHLGERLVTT